LNYLTALGTFIFSTFIKPPKLPTAAAAQTINDMPVQIDAHGAKDLRAAEGQQAGSGGVIGAVNRFLVSIKEEEDFRYSAWILTPLWLSLLLMVFWFLSGVSTSKHWVDCAKQPDRCLSNEVAPWLKYVDAYLDTSMVRNLALRMQADGHDRLQDVSDTTGIAVMNLDDIQTYLQNAADVDTSTLQELKTYFDDARDYMKNWNATMHDVGSQVTNEVYSCMMQAGGPLERYIKAAERAYTIARWLGHGLATIFAFISLINILQTFKRVLLHQRRLEAHRQASVTSGKGARVSSESSDASTRRDQDAMVMIPPGATEGYPAAFASTTMMQTIQTLEEDMKTIGIGASVTLFGVLTSTMWIQVRIIGFVFTIAITVVLHPLFWEYGVKTFWPTIVVLLTVVIFNMVIVKMLLGNNLLSDGTRVKHAGAFMTYFLCFQLAFLVVGVLYASWRVIWALIITLLYSVACLDRSILLIGKCLDGPYGSFVGSIKLERAWEHIHEPYTPPPADPNKKSVLSCLPCCAKPTAEDDK